MEILGLISLILSIVALFKINSLNNTIREIKSSTAVPSVIPSPQVTAPPDSRSTPPAVINTPITTPTVKAKTGFEKLLSWYAHEWPLKTGALFILLGFLWLVSYAFLNNWVGPVGRITFGFIVGTAVLYYGSLRVKIVQSQGITLTGLGAGIILITTYAAQNLYEMFPPFVALIFMILTMAFTAFVSLRHRVLSLAVMSLIIGGIAPALIGAEERSIVGLFGYLLGVVMSTIWIARYSTWRILSLLSLVLVVLYSMSYFMIPASLFESYLTPKELTEITFFAITFCSLFYFATVASIVTNNKATTLDLITATAVGFFTLAWINTLALPEYKSIIVLGSSLSYAVASYVIFLRTKIPQAVQVYTVVSMILLAVATAFEFDGPTLITAFAVEALLLPIISSRFLGLKMTKYMLLYHVLPVSMGIAPLLGTTGEPFSQDLVIMIMVTISTLVSGLYFYYQNTSKDKDLHSVSILLILVGAFYGLVTLWQVADEFFFPESLARAVTLIIYTVIGLGSYIIAGIHSRPVLKKFGLVLLIVVIGRLLVFEIWSMELTGRIITFFLIGLLFIGSVLFVRKQKNS